MGTVAPISANPARQLNSMVHLVMVVRSSTAPVVLMSAQSLKVRYHKSATALL